VTLALGRVGTEHDEHAAFLSALTEARLPTDDLDGGGRYFAFYENRALFGFGGLEGAGPDQMVRSLVIPLSVRGRGFGQAIVHELVEQAKADGIEQLWLLTTSADGFFAKLGWHTADRASAPDAIRTSRQFAGLCPSSAVLMCRRLA